MCKPKTGESRVNEVIVDFRLFFQEHAICLLAASRGMEEFANKLGLQQHDDARFWLSKGISSDRCNDLDDLYASVNHNDFVNKCKSETGYISEISKSLLCMVYSAWDENYRHQIASAAECEAKDVKADLMGDIRKVRHWIIHNKSVVNENDLPLKELDWDIKKGKLVITFDMFCVLVQKVNKMPVIVQRLHPFIEQVLAVLSSADKKHLVNWKSKDPNRDMRDWPKYSKYKEQIEKIHREFCD